MAGDQPFEVPRSPGTLHYRLGPILAERPPPRVFFRPTRFDFVAGSFLGAVFFRLFACLAGFFMGVSCGFEVHLRSEFPDRVPSSSPERPTNQGSTKAPSVPECPIASHHP